MLYRAHQLIIPVLFACCRHLFHVTSSGRLFTLRFLYIVNNATDNRRHIYYRQKQCYHKQPVNRFTYIIQCNQRHFMNHCAIHQNFECSDLAVFFYRKFYIGQFPLIGNNRCAIGRLDNTIIFTSYNTYRFAIVFQCSFQGIFLDNWYDFGTFKPIGQYLFHILINRFIRCT